MKCLKGEKTDEGNPYQQLTGKIHPNPSAALHKATRVHISELKEALQHINYSIVNGQSLK